MISPHGGNTLPVAAQLGYKPTSFIDASASLSPYTPLGRCFHLSSIRSYPDPEHSSLRSRLSVVHSIPREYIICGNGAAELFTWVAREASALGQSSIPAPGFADYQRALSCWNSSFGYYDIPLSWPVSFPSDFPASPAGDVLWISNPHNPTGHLWSFDSLTQLLGRYKLVVIDEAFLPLVPKGEVNSLLRLVPHYPNLVVVRSLTKLFGIAGLRLGYAISHPDRLHLWSQWRDPWPVNGLALEASERLLRNSNAYRRWSLKVQNWTSCEGSWLSSHLQVLPGVTPMPSAANFLLLRGDFPLTTIRMNLERNYRIILRDCSNFKGLGEHWLRIGYQSRRLNKCIVHALRNELFSNPHPSR